MSIIFRDNFLNAKFPTKIKFSWTNVSHEVRLGSHIINWYYFDLFGNLWIKEIFPKIKYFILFLFQVFLSGGWGVRPCYGKNFNHKIWRLHSYCDYSKSACMSEPFLGYLSPCSVQLGWVKYLLIPANFWVAKDIRQYNSLICFLRCLLGNILF